MRVNIISDIHDDIGQCTYSHLKHEPKDADLILYAGDMGPRFFEETKGNKKYFGCFGNHYYYGNNKFERKGHVDILELEKYVFFATTLWTDFKYGGELEDNMDLSERMMNDYRRIKYKGKLLTAKDVYEEHLMSKRCLEWNLHKHRDKRCIIITHHAPSLKSIPKKYKGQQINCAYVSDMEEFIKERPQIVLWTHGHTHETLDYKIGHCRVVCNSRGYEHYAGIIENNNFNPKLIVEV